MHFYLNLIPRMKSINDFNLENKEEIKRLEKGYPAFLVDIYRRRGKQNEAVKLLKKVYKDKGIDQVSRTYLLFGNFKGLEKYLKGDVQSRNARKLKLTLELHKNIKEVYFDSPAVCKYLATQEAVFKSWDIKHIVHPIDNVEYKCPASFKVYNYLCKTPEYQNILATILELLLESFNANLIFLYFHILTVSCVLHKCKGECINAGYDTIRNEISDPAFLDFLGYNDLLVLYEVFGDEEFLERMNRKNPQVEEKYKIELPTKKPLVNSEGEAPIIETVSINNLHCPNSITVAGRLRKETTINTKKRFKKNPNASGLSVTAHTIKLLCQDKHINTYEDLYESDFLSSCVGDVLTKPKDPKYNVP